MELDKKLYALRKTNGFSQEQLAEKLGVSRQAVSKWEAGTSVPELSKLRELAKLYHVSLDTLLGLAETTITEAGGTPGSEVPKESTVVPPPSSSPPPKAGAVRRLSGVALLLLAIAVIVCLSKLHSLEGKLESLQLQLSNQSGALSSRIDSIHSNVSAMLQEQDTLYVSYQCTVADVDYASHGASFSLSFQPKQYEEGMAVSFLAKGPDGASLDVPAVETEGHMFVATTPLISDLEDDNCIELRVSVTKDGQTELQLLDTIYADILTRYVPAGYGRFSGDASGGLTGVSLDGQIEFQLSRPQSTALRSVRLEIYCGETLYDTISFSPSDFAGGDAAGPDGAQTWSDLTDAVVSFPFSGTFPQASSWEDIVFTGVLTGTDGTEYRINSNIYGPIYDNFLYFIWPEVQKN